MTSVEYVINLKDLVSGKFEQINNVFDASVGKITNIQNKLQSLTSFGGKSIDGLRGKIDKLTEMRNAEKSIQSIRRLNTDIRQTQRQLQKLENLPPLSFIERIRSASGGFGAIARNALGAFGAIGVFQSVKGIIKLGSDIEQTNIAFETMLGSADGAKKLIGELNEYANITPYENNDLYDQAKLLLNFGVAQEKILPSLRMLGDVAMGDKNKLQGLTLAFSQIQSTGRLMGQDLLQLINTGFNPLQELSKMTGKSMGTLKEEMGKGQISADMVTEAFKRATSEGGRFFNMSEKMSQTAMGKLSTLMGKLKLQLSGIGLSLLEKLKPLIDFAISLVDKFKPVSDVFGQIWESIKPLLTSLWELISAFVGISGNGATAEGTISRLTGIMNAFKTPIMIVAEGLKATLDLITWMMPVLKPLLIGYAIWTAAQWALNAAMYANPIWLVVAAIVAFVGSIITAWKKFEGFRGFIFALWASIKAVFMNIGNLAKQIFGGLGDIIAGVIQMDVTKIGAGIKKIGGSFKEFGNAVGGAWTKGFAEGVADFQNDQAAKAEGGGGGGLIPGGVPSVALPTGGGFVLPGGGIDTVNGKGGSGRSLVIKLDALIGTNNNYFDTVKDADVTSFKDKLKLALQSVLNDVNYAI